MFGKIAFLVLQLCTVGVFCYTYTKPAKPCDTKDNDCALKMVSDFFKAAINGDPSEGFEAIDPMHHDEIQATLPTINFTLKDSTIKGLKNLQLLSVETSDHDSTYVTLVFPEYEMSGMYEMNGIFLNTPLLGNGPFSLNGTDIKVKCELMYGYYKKEDGIHMKLTNFEFTTELVGKMHVDIQNLFDGNKVLGDSALNLLNHNDKMLAAVWNPPITRANLEKIIKNMNRIHEDVLLNDLISEDLSKKPLIN